MRHHNIVQNSAVWNNQSLEWAGPVTARCSPARFAVPWVFEMSTAVVVFVLFACDELMFVESMFYDMVK